MAKEITKIDSLHVFKLASRRPQKYELYQKILYEWLERLFFYCPPINIDQQMESSIL